MKCLPRLVLLFRRTLFQLLLCLSHFLEKTQIDWHSLTHPRRPLSVIPLVVPRIGMNQGTQWTSINHQPWNEGSKLYRGENVDLEHGDRVRPHGLVPYAVNP